MTGTTPLKPTFSLLSSNTIQGVVLAILGWLSAPGNLDLLSFLPNGWGAKISTVATALGALLGVFGLRKAVAKNGNGA